VDAPGASLSAVPQLPQNFSPGSVGLPQLGQGTASDVPHSTQNRAPGLFSVPHFEQITDVPRLGHSESTRNGHSRKFELRRGADSPAMEWWR
jgi:hypothetical protein